MVLEHRDLLGHPERVVPGEHHDHRADVDPLRATREVRQVLVRVGHHDVRRRVLLECPERVEPERLDEIGQVHLILEDLAVGDLHLADLFRRGAGLQRHEAIPVRVIRINETHPKTHKQPLSGGKRERARALPRPLSVGGATRMDGHGPTTRPPRRRESTCDAFYARSGCRKRHITRSCPRSAGRHA